MNIAGADPFAEVPAPTDLATIHSLIDQKADEYGVPRPLAHAMAKQESGYGQYRVGTSGEQGVYQLMPGTAKELGVTNSFDAAQNIDGGLRYFSQLRKKYGNDDVALTAYNAGPHNVDTGVATPTTSKYVPIIKSLAKQFAGKVGNALVPPAAADESHVDVSFPDIEAQDDPFAAASEPAPAEEPVTPQVETADTSDDPFAAVASQPETASDVNDSLAHPIHVDVTSVNGVPEPSPQEQLKAQQAASLKQRMQATHTGPLKGAGTTPDFLDEARTKLSDFGQRLFAEDPEGAEADLAKALTRGAAQFGAQSAAALGSLIVGAAAKLHGQDFTKAAGDFQDKFAELLAKPSKLAPSLNPTPGEQQAAAVASLPFEAGKPLGEFAQDLGAPPVVAAALEQLPIAAATLASAKGEKDVAERPVAGLSKQEQLKAKQTPVAPIPAPEAPSAAPVAETGKTPDQPTAEPQVQLQAQITAFNEGRKPAVLFTSEHEIPDNLPDANFARVDGGLLMYRDRAALDAYRAGKTGEALGYGIDEKPSPDAFVQSGAQTVTARDEHGVPIQDVATDGRPEVVAAAEQVAGPKGSVETRPAVDALAEREARKATEATAATSEVTHGQDEISEGRNGLGGHGGRELLDVGDSTAGEGRGRRGSGQAAPGGDLGQPGLNGVRGIDEPGAGGRPGDGLGQGEGLRGVRGPGSAEVPGQPQDGLVNGRLTPTTGEKPPSVMEGGVSLPTRAEVNAAAKQTDLHPTDEQKESGAYAKGHLDFGGLDIDIENPKGSVRSGKDETTGKPWSSTMSMHYGEIRGIPGADGDKLDVFIGPYPDNNRAFIIDQNKPGTGEFDEHKIVLGAQDAAQAERLYKKSFAGDFGDKVFGSISEPMTIDQLKAKLPELHKAPHNGGLENAEAVRGNQEVGAEARPAEEGGGAHRGGDLQQEPQAGGEAGGALQQVKEAQSRPGHGIGPFEDNEVAYNAQNIIDADRVLQALRLDPEATQRASDLAEAGHVDFGTEIQRILDEHQPVETPVRGEGLKPAMERRPERADEVAEQPSTTGKTSIARPDTEAGRGERETGARLATEGAREPRARSTSETARAAPVAEKPAARPEAETARPELAKAAEPRVTEAGAEQRAAGAAGEVKAPRKGEAGRQEVMRENHKQFLEGQKRVEEERAQKAAETYGAMPVDSKVQMIGYSPEHYWVKVADNRWQRAFGGKPDEVFKTDTEMQGQRIEPAQQEKVKAKQTKPEIKKPALSVDDVKSIADPIVKRLKGVKVSVVKDEAALPEGTRKLLSSPGAGKVEGVYTGHGQIYLVADALRDANHVRQVLAHEALGHLGPEETLSSREYHAALDSVGRLEKAGHAGIKALAKQVDRSDPNLSPRQRAKEILARAVDKGLHKTSPPVQRTVAAVTRAVKNFLRNLGFKGKWVDHLSEPEIFAMLRAAERNLETRRGAAGRVSGVEEVQASRAPAEADPAEGVRRMRITVAAIDRQRVERGEQPFGPRFSKGFGAWADEALAQLANDPDAARSLVGSLVDKPRPPNGVETALMNYHNFALNEERARLSKILNDDTTSDAQRHVAVTAQARVTDELRALEGVLRNVATLSSDSLRARQMFADEGYTLPNIESALRVAKGDKLDEAEHKQVEQLAKEAKDTSNKANQTELKQQRQDRRQQAAATVEAIKEKIQKEDVAAKQRKEPVRDLPAEKDSLIKALRKENAEGRSLADLGSYIKKLAENFVRQGIKEVDPLIDAVHDVLVKEVDPDITRDDAHDALAGYGNFKPLNPDPIKAELRDLTGQAQQMAKLRDIRKGKPPKRSGLEQRKKSDKERRLEAQVKEEMRRTGIVATDPAKQLKSFNDSRKTWLENRLSDLRYQMATGKKFVKGATPELNAENKRLQAEYDEVKQAHKEMFPKEPLSDQQRAKIAEKAVDREIEKAQQDIERLLGVRGKLPKEQLPVHTAVLDAKRAQLEALRDQRETFKNVLNPKKTPQEIAEQRLWTYYQNRTANLLGQIARNDLDPKPKYPFYDPILRKTRYVEKVPQWSKDTLEAKDLAAKAKKAVDQAIALKQYQNRGWLERGLDWGVRLRRFVALSSPAVLTKLVAAAGLRLTFMAGEQGIGHGLLKLPTIGDILQRSPRYGPGFSTEALALSYTHAFTDGLKDSADALTTGHSTLFDQWGKNADAGVGEASLDVNGWPEWASNIHAAIKAPVMRAEFELSLYNRTLFYMKEGIDVTDPWMRMRLGHEAFDDALRSVFLQDSALATRIQHALRKEYDPRTGDLKPMSAIAHYAGRAYMPVTKVPTNVVAEALGEYFTPISYGRAALSIRKALRDGIKNLPGNEADAISRQLIRGTVGAPLLAAGWLLYKSISGFYQQGQKPDPDMKPGDIKIGDTRIPANLMHHPAIAALNVAATARRIAESKTNKKDLEAQGIGWGALGGMLGLIEESPYVGSDVHLTQLFDPKERHRFVGDTLRDMLVPQILQYAAKVQDSDASLLDILTGNINPQRREPRGIGQSFETGLPWLRQDVPIKQPKGGGTSHHGGIQGFKANKGVSTIHGF